MGAAAVPYEESPTKLNAANHGLIGFSFDGVPKRGVES
jgi:hypothetical protein